MLKDEVIIIDNSHIEIVHKLIKKTHPFFNKITLCVNSFIRKEIDFIPEVLDKIVFLDVDISTSRFDLDFCSNSPLVLSSIETGSIEFFKFINGLDNKKFVVLHNINFWQKKGTLFKILPRPRSDKHKQMLILLEEAFKLIVLSEELKYGIKSYKLKTKTIIFNSAFCEYENTKKVNPDRIKIAIPGQYEQKRKNFDLVFELITSIKKNRFEFIFLGSPIDKYGKELILNFQSLISRGYDIIYFEDFVSEKVFNDIMLDSDLIFAPINKKTTFQGIEEVYTKTKITGSIADMIRFQKPGMLPYFAKVPLGYSDAIFQYKSLTELVQFLECENLVEFIRVSKETSAKFKLEVNHNDFIEQLLRV
jgi:hypothetical protein